MKRKEAIKQIQEGKAQVLNDYRPSTKEIKKFLEEAFPEDTFGINKDNKFLLKKYFDNSGSSSESNDLWFSENKPFKDKVIINLSTITKRKKTKLSQLEQQFTELSKDVAELRQSLTKDVEVVAEEVKSELIVGEWYKVFYQEVLGEQWGLIEIQSIQEDRIVYKGFYKQDWNEDWCHPRNKFIKATPQEVETALVNEAKKKYKKGDRVLGLYSDSVVTLSLETTILSDSPYHLDQFNQLWMRTSGGLNERVFQDGIWAEIKETIKEEVINWNVPQLVMTEGGKVVATNGNHDKDTFNGILLITDNNLQDINEFSTRWVKYLFKPFKGKLTIEQSI